MQHPSLNEVDFFGESLSNRLAVAPMSRVSAHSDGTPTDLMAEYYAKFAEGGFGVVISEGAFTDENYSKAYENQPGLTTEEHRAGWETVTDRVHAEDGFMVAQLMHAGALSQTLQETVAPSAVQPKGEKMAAYGGSGPFPTPHSMDDDEINQAIEGFVSAALTAQRAGFDGVEVHGANGYLIDQFLTTYTNQRTDSYGGSVENRARFATQVVSEIQDAVDSDFVVGIRLSQTKVNDFDYRWPGGREEAEIILTELDQAGADYFHYASEGRDWMKTADLGGITVTKLARELTEVPVIANGGMHDPQQAKQVLEDGHADLLSLARGALANPDWPKKLEQNRPFEEFSEGMITPKATIQNTIEWRQQKQVEPV